MKMQSLLNFCGLAGSKPVVFPCIKKHTPEVFRFCVKFFLKIRSFFHTGAYLIQHANTSFNGFSAGVILVWSSERAAYLDLRQK